MVASGNKGGKQRRKKKRKAKERAMRAGWGTVLGHLCVALSLPWLLVSVGVGSQGSEDVVGLSVFSVLPLLVTTPFVYYGASRLVAPHLPMWTVQTEHGYTSDGVGVMMHTGSKKVVISRRKAALNLAVGLGIWLVGVWIGVSIAGSHAGS